MSIVRTLIGNVKGPQGDTGATGPQGTPGVNGTDGAAATISVGTVSTTAYGNPAEVTNSGTSSAAVFDFVIPQGQPGEEVTDMSGLTLGTMTTQTAQFPTPQIGDNGATLWGKVVKYFSDLRTLIGTKLNTSNVVNNFTTTESGYALDARAGKTLSDSLTHRRMPGSYTEQQCYGAVGYITTSQKDAVIDIPMVWNSKASAISLSSIKVAMRGENGYLGGANGFDLTPYVTGGHMGLAQGILHVTATKSDGFSNTNNTCYIGTVTISYTLS